MRCFYGKNSLQTFSETIDCLTPSIPLRPSLVDMPNWVGEYPGRVATGTIAAGGNLGILNPASVTMMVYGIATETSIGRLFLAIVVGVHYAMYGEIGPVAL